MCKEITKHFGQNKIQKTFLVYRLASKKKYMVLKSKKAAIKKSKIFTLIRRRKKLLMV